MERISKSEERMAKEIIEQARSVAEEFGVDRSLCRGELNKRGDRFAVAAPQATFSEMRVQLASTESSIAARRSCPVVSHGILIVPSISG